MAADFRANHFDKQKKTVSKRILFTLDKNPINQDEGFAKKIRFHYTEKMLLPAGISKKSL